MYNGIIFPWQDLLFRSNSSINITLDVHYDEKHSE